ncbi:MAG: Gfo/Idh/MocA family oxidoreductase [Armatimonadetes bacterium]|nr:Gfo/Idh/MocA family oxidoreductase [Armatimonadota bacterium]
MSTYRAAIVGLSSIGARRPEPIRNGALVLPMPGSHVAAYAVLPQVEVVAFCDLKADLLARFRADWSDVWPEARGYENYGEMLAREDIDLLSVVTGDNRHADIVVDACQAGVRAIFCEKPLATTLADADRMIAACGARGVVMSVDHTRRWMAIWQRAREAIRAGEIGRPARIIATLGGPRAMLFRNGTHLLDAVNFLVESDPVWVVAALDPGFEDYCEYRGDGGHDPASEPGGAAIVEYASGARAFINASKGTPSEFSVTVIGESGKIAVSDVGAELYRAAVGATRPLHPGGWRLQGIAAGVEELIRALESGSEVSSPPEAARQALAIIVAMLESQRRGSCPESFRD